MKVCPGVGEGRGEGSSTCGVGYEGPEGALPYQGPAEPETSLVECGEEVLKWIVFKGL